MPKGYWGSVYCTISDPEKPAAYNKLTAPAVKAGGGRTFVRDGRVVAHDAGIAERTVLIEFDSFEQAVAAHESAAYQEVLVALSDGVEEQCSRPVDQLRVGRGGRTFPNDPVMVTE
ncbi:DUF1330 domain-containing protein [Streptomyces canus]|uniref:DUF1330 domain-containing protein n=1 Tax=Streptomyces canus TaxID=58343 RepID=UPI003711B5C6